MNKSSERYQMKTPLTIYVHNAQGEQIFYFSISVYPSIYLCVYTIFHIYLIHPYAFLFFFSHSLLSSLRFYFPDEIYHDIWI